METELPPPLSRDRELSLRLGGSRLGGPWGGAAPRPADRPSGGRPRASTPEDPLPPAGGWKEQRERRTHPSSGVGLRRPPERAARPPGHMAQSRAEDQRGFVAAEQGASQSAGRGRRDCDCLRREAPGELTGSEGQAGKRGASCAGGVICGKKRQGAALPSQSQSPQKESDRVPGEAPREGEGERGSPGPPARLPVPEARAPAQSPGPSSIPCPPPGGGTPVCSVVPTI